MREHELKVWPVYYAAMVSGEKRYEFRHDDRGFRSGDMLHLREWDNVTREYTGRSMRRRIGWISDTLTSAVWGSGVILSLVEDTATLSGRVPETTCGMRVVTDERVPAGLAQIRTDGGALLATLDLIHGGYTIHTSEPK